MNHTTKLQMVSALSARAHILMEAAESICGYCHGTSGHESHPVKQYGQWDHLFMVGNGSNPCAAGAIWNLIEQCCIEMGCRYTPWGEPEFPKEVR